jgi:hypothetical protein
MEMIPRMKRRPEKMMELMLRSPSSLRDCAERVASMATWARIAAKGMMEETTRVENTTIVEGSKASKEEEIDSTRIMVEEDTAEEMKGSTIVTGSIETNESRASATIVANQATWPLIVDLSPNDDRGDQAYEGEVALMAREVEVKENVEYWKKGKRVHGNNRMGR